MHCGTGLFVTAAIPNVDSGPSEENGPVPLLEFNWVSHPASPAPCTGVGAAHEGMRQLATGGKPQAAPAPGPACPWQRVAMATR